MYKVKFEGKKKYSELSRVSRNSGIDEITINNLSLTLLIIEENKY